MSWTPQFVHRKWPNKIVPFVNFVFSRDGHFGLGGGGVQGGVPRLLPRCTAILILPEGGGRGARLGLRQTRRQPPHTPTHGLRSKGPDMRGRIRMHKLWPLTAPPPPSRPPVKGPCHAGCAPASAIHNTESRARQRPPQTMGTFLSPKRWTHWCPVAGRQRLCREAAAVCPRAHAMRSYVTPEATHRLHEAMAI